VRRGAAEQGGGDEHAGVVLFVLKLMVANMSDFAQANAAGGRKLFAAQRDDVVNMATKRTVALLYEQGGGKTTTVAHWAALRGYQNVLIVTLEALRAGRLREGDRLASFVLGVCRMTVLDLRRNAQRRSELLGRFGAGVAVALPEAMPSLDRNQLAACLKTLRERERAVVVMTFYDEKSSMDVSRFLGVSEANVRVMRHRAIHQLRDCMGGAT
jgi:RNA polymerase sigma-70 factor (ECF subfamily)